MMFSQIPALILGVCSSAAVITTTFWNQWSISGPTSNGVLGPIWAWRSLFGECMQYQGGQSQCQGQNSMFLMSGYKLALRGLMISAIILSCLACIGVLVGSECTKIFENNKRMKRKLMFGSGIAFLLTGLFTFTSVAWYTAIVYNDFFKFEKQDNYIQWELGACVYLGYIGSFVCVLTFFACVCRPGPREESSESSKNYFFYKPHYYDRETSRDKEQSHGLLEKNKLKCSVEKLSDKSSSRNSTSKQSSRKSSSKSSSRSGGKVTVKDSDRKSSSIKFSGSSSTRSSKVRSIESRDSGCTSETYRYSAYV